MPAISGPKRLILGREHDDGLRARVLAVLRQLEARTRASSWDVGGCEEETTHRFLVDGQEITLSSGTKAGLALEGPAGLVEKIRAKVEAAPLIDEISDGRLP